MAGVGSPASRLRFPNPPSRSPTPPRLPPPPQRCPDAAPGHAARVPRAGRPPAGGHRAAVPAGRRLEAGRRAEAPRARAGEGGGAGPPGPRGRAGSDGLVCANPGTRRCRGMPANSSPNQGYMVPMGGWVAGWVGWWVHVEGWFCVAWVCLGVGGCGCFGEWMGRWVSGGNTTPFFLFGKLKTCFFQRFCLFACVCVCVCISAMF